MSSRNLLPVLLLAFSIASCKSQSETTEPTEPAKPTAVEAEPAAAPEAEAKTAKSDPTCVGPVTTGTPETRTLAGATWELDGSTLTLRSPLEGNKLVIGAITDIKEDTEENKANLRTLLTWFEEKDVSLVVVAGDTGADQAQIEGALDVLAAAEVPVLNIIGNRSGKGDYRKAMDAVTARHQNVFDLSLVRRVDTPAADLVSMPGYFDPSYIHSDDGCPYYSADLETLATLIDASDSPVVAVSHGGPQQQGANAIDRTAQGGNVGDPALAKLLASKKVPFGIFGNIHEAGGRATDLGGQVVLEQAKPHDALYLNPGPADSVRWMMNDGTESVGMGAVLTIQDGKATYEVNRLGEQAVAKKSAKKGKKGNKGK